MLFAINISLIVFLISWSYLLLHYIPFFPGTFPPKSPIFELFLSRPTRRQQWHPTPSSCLANPMDRGAWKAAVHGVAKNLTQLSDFTFTFHFHALEKEMATQLQCSGLENPRDRGAWWAAVYGVAQSRTRLKQLSSSSSSRLLIGEGNGTPLQYSCLENHMDGGIC